MKRRYILIAAGLIFFAFLAFVFRPVPILAEKDCLTVSGVLISASEGSSYDVVLRLAGDNTHYYINRGLERGLTMEQVRGLLNEPVVLKYPSYWTPLDPGNGSRHISKIESRGEVIFTELKE
jgi:hypothetical protein